MITLSGMTQTMMATETIKMVTIPMPSQQMAHNGDADGDGYGDNQNGNNPDKFPQDNTQWQDGDLDGFGDNANGNNPDLCPGTPFGETVDANGCSTSQTDEDMDGVPDNQDACANTPAGEFVNTNGCSATQLDDDNDGVVNQYDLCPVTHKMQWQILLVVPIANLILIMMA